MRNSQRRIETAKTILISQRNYRRARDRALAKLAGKYREEYLELLHQEKEKDAKEGKAWLDIDGRTYASSSMDRATLDTQPVQTAEDTNRSNL